MSPCVHSVLTGLIWLALVASVIKTHAAGACPYMEVVLTGLLATVSGAAAFSLCHRIAPERSLEVGRYVYVDGPRACMTWIQGVMFASLRVMLATSFTECVVAGLCSCLASLYLATLCLSAAVKGALMLVEYSKLPICGRCAK